MQYFSMSNENNPIFVKFDGKMKQSEVCGTYNFLNKGQN